jgi:hypothetical protein
MNSSQKSRLFLCVVSTALLSLMSAGSQAGRSVRSDSSDGAFEFLGGFWGSDVQQFGEPGFAVRTEFKLKINPSGDARYFTVCMSEEGFLKLIGNDNITCADSDYDLPPTGNYIAVFATELDSIGAGFGSLRQTRGFVDSSAPFRLWQADPAMRFWWNGVTLGGDTVNTFDVQVVLIDRSDGTNNGNFDIEMNYGVGGDQVPPFGTETNPNANGFQGFKLGPNTRGPTLGPFGPFDTNGAPIRYCFRGGTLRATCN